MPRLLVAIAAGAALCSSPSFAGSYSISGVGTTPCPEVAALLNEPIGRSRAIAWATGFMSGANLLLSLQDNPGRDLAKLNADLIAGSIRAYCVDHPNDQMLIAVASLFSSLPQRAVQP